MVKEIKRGKKERAIEDSFVRSKKYSLGACYSSYSIAKKKAFDYCRDLHEFLDNGTSYLYDYAIVSFNSNIFTYGGIFVNDLGDTYFLYITPTKNLCWKIE